VSDSIIDLQHHFDDVIMTNIHIHLDRDQCLEIVLVRGLMDRIKSLVDRISAIKGVLNVRLITAVREI
jgi:CopG family nickel-responsive transcriptional regulator